MLVQWEGPVIATHGAMGSGWAARAKALAATRVLAAGVHCFVCWVSSQLRVRRCIPGSANPTMHMVLWVICGSLRWHLALTQP